MAIYYTGSAVLEKNLQIAKADEQFYEYIGSENYASVAGNIHPDGLPYFKKAVEDIQDEESASFVIRFKNAVDNEYHHVLTNLRGISLSGGDLQGHFVEMQIQDIETLGKRLEQMVDKDNIYSELLELWGEQLFVYDVGADYLQIFSGGNKNRINNFKGKLEDFRNAIIKDGAVAKEYESAFDEFCDALAEGTKFFEYKMLFCAEGVDAQKHIHYVKGKTFLDGKEQKIVVGYISRRNLADGSITDQSEKQFETDVTTGVLTKKAILNYTENLLMRKPKYKVNLCIIDIDNFKAVNDTLGHMFGDEVLAKVASILQDAVEGKGIVGRIGGDEMFVVLEGIETLSDLRGVLRSIRNNVEWAYLDRKEVPKVTCSIGVSTYPTDAVSYDDLFQIADKMLYRAKQKGKNRYIVYAPNVHGDVLHGEEVVNVQNTAAGRQDKEDLVLKMLEYAAKQSNVPYNMIFQDIGTTFGLDEIHMVYGDAQKVLLESSWSSEENDGGTGDSEIDFVREDNFVHLYREHNLAVIDKLDLIEQLCPKTHKYMLEHGIRTALIYKMNCENHEGYITYYKKSDISRKWSDSDLANLTYISKILELVINDR